ncbi:MAG: MoaD family protein [Chloroflexi bacterium]|nr:MoaD family protein [Chloroflexota bacterium]
MSNLPDEVDAAGSQFKIRYIGLIQNVVGKREEVWSSRTTTVRGLIDSLAGRYGTELENAIMTADGRLPRYVKILVNGKDVEQLEGLDSKLEGTEEVSLVVAIPQMSGG